MNRTVEIVTECTLALDLFPALLETRRGLGGGRVDWGTGAEELLVATLEQKGGSLAPGGTRIVSAVILLDS